jgi:Ser/Thr protein kinase RdoA (MazF antagonist)
MTPHTLTAEDLEFAPPSLPIELLEELARTAYGVEGTSTSLRGERDQNLQITTAEGKSFVLKVANAYEDPGIVDFQIEGLLHLEATDPELTTPRVVRTRDGDTTAGLLGPDGNVHAARMLTFVPGETFDDPMVQALTSSSLRGIGSLQGRLCRALASFDHPHAEHFMAWDISNGLVTSDALWAYAQPDVVELAGWTQEHLATSAFTVDTTRRRQIIHNDAHRGNILRTEGTIDVCGLIDFGDMLVAPLANELAIPGISFVNARRNPLDALTPLIAGFHDEYPLDAMDVAVLYDSITARAVLTALLFDFQIAECHDMTDDIAGAKPRVMSDLTMWLSQDPNEFHDHIATALDIT